MRKSRTQSKGEPNNGIDVTIFSKGNLLKGKRDAKGNVFAEDGHIYQFNTTTQRWVNVTATTKVAEVKQQVAQSRDNLGKIIVMDDGSAYQYQDVEGEIVLVCILKNPPKFVSLSFVPGSMHGRIPARSPGR